MGTGIKVVFDKLNDLEDPLADDKLKQQERVDNV